MTGKQVSNKIQAPQGMFDITPENQPFYKKVYGVGEKISSFYGFKEITPPILESTELFERGTGEATEIVEKQMYSLKTKGGDSLTLRPEFTPSMARAYVEHGMISLPQPVKMFSFGPVFRHEKPQAGRYRQFHQFNIEAFGSKRPIMDVEIIYVFYNILQALGIKKLIIELNSIGDKECIGEYKKLLVRYLKKNEHSLCADCKRRLKMNPLRIMDCKQERCKHIVLGAPQIIDHLCKECHNHFKKVLEFLDELGLPYSLNPCLVRGLDYYTRTVFEIIAEDELGRQLGSLVGGGRYDNLVKLFSRKNIPACGAAAGVERIITIMKERNLGPAEIPGPQVFLAQLGDIAKIRSLKLMEDLRKAGISVAELFDRESLSAQLRGADKSKALYSLIIGEEEASRDMIIIRDMADGRQTSVKIDKVVGELKKKLKQ
ncbi:histidine--tRNA ligase [Patescibacteria group bacterium]|nr:histidine--tRNA ligase [Patescibacteria group bacterium]MBU4162331.1 histidine--tRNA ligase [Patescibacteria group bacterium]